MSNEEYEDVFDESIKDSVEEPTPELQAADENTDEEPSSDVEIPDKFQGKSIEDVIKAYTNLETEHGRKANEVGELRKLTDDILKSNLAKKDEPETEPVGFDDFVEDPEAAVEKALKNNPRLKHLEETISKQTQTAAHKTLIEQHPDVDEIVGSGNFQKWLGDSGARTRMFREAHQSYDVELASELIDLYKAGRKTSNEDAAEMRDAKAANNLLKATTEKGGNTAVVSEKKYRRADLIRLKIEDPAKYAAMGDEIRQAYAEKRVI